MVSRHGYHWKAVLTYVEIRNLVMRYDLSQTITFEKRNDEELKLGCDLENGLLSVERNMMTNPQNIGMLYPIL